jgi:hypothetical protein
MVEANAAANARAAATRPPWAGARPLRALRCNVRGRQSVRGGSCRGVPLERIIDSGPVAQNGLAVDVIEEGGDVALRSVTRKCVHELIEQFGHRSKALVTVRRERSQDDVLESFRITLHEVTRENQ